MSEPRVTVDQETIVASYNAMARELAAYKAEHAQLVVALKVCSDVVMLTSAVGGHYAPISQDDWNRAFGLAAPALRLPLAAAVLAAGERL